tara:strand:- start:596 stop:2182 length:1587 start_codon:yes stop_codon:yes gene_type:complete
VLQRGDGNIPPRGYTSYKWGTDVMTVADIQEDSTSHGESIAQVPIEQIKIRYRLRSPKQSKIEELAESIRTLGLMNPITVDNELYLIAGFHRLNAYKLLGYKAIPAIVKDYSKLHSELGEIDENLKRSSLSHIEIAEHMVKREEVLEQMGLRMISGFNSNKGLISTDELAKEFGVTKRQYRMKKQPAKIVEDVRDALRDTKWSDVLMDMVKLSQQTPEVQRKVSQLLITGKCSTFKRAFVEGNIQVMRRTKDYKIDFDMKARWGTPHSIHRFTKSKIELQEICNLVAKDEDVAWVKRDGLHFGETTIPVYGMAADHAEFLVTYYTPEGGTVLDCFMGRATNGFASLEHGRKFIGYDVFDRNVNRTKEVMDEYYPDSDYQLFHSDGTELAELKDESEYLDAVVTDPPYFLKAEKYSKDGRDLSSMTHQEYMDRIRNCFTQLHRLIKTSKFDEKIFYPVIFKVSHQRRGTRGIIDMDKEFQEVALDCGFVLWDKLFNKLHSPWGTVNWERNYMNRYVQKNYEVNLTFVKF